MSHLASSILYTHTQTHACIALLLFGVFIFFSPAVCVCTEHTVNSVLFMQCIYANCRCNVCKMLFHSNVLFQLVSYIIPSRFSFNDTIQFARTCCVRLVACCFPLLLLLILFDRFLDRFVEWAKAESSVYSFYIPLEESFNLRTNY